MDAHYLEVNTQGFEGDSFFKKTMQDLIDKHGVKVVVETGTFRGYTTLQLAKMADTVYTVETNIKYYLEATPKFEGTGIRHYYGNSVNILPIILDECKDKNTLLFLDAHWESHNPLLQELAIIKDKGMKPIVVIHDFLVPDHPELGFDSYGGQDYNWDWISKSIEYIYGEDGYTYFYNSEADGMKRGIIFIIAK